MTLPKPVHHVQSVARFQSLQVGQYWRATRAILEHGIDDAMVLLIQSIRWVDERPHTIVLRPHPSKIGRSEYLQIPQDDGATHARWIRYDEHRFLLDEFLAAFEFEPDYQRIRAQELHAVQERVAALQGELLESQRAPALLASVVAAGLRENAANSSGADREGEADPGSADAPPPGTSLQVAASAQDQNIVSMATGAVANALDRGLTEKTVEAMKAAAGEQHAIATIKSNWIQSKTKEIADTISSMAPFYEEQAAAALAQTEDVRSYVGNLIEGIESLDLYLGKDVTVTTIREGSPAARDVPLTFVQKKLKMDEELAVWTDLDAWFDFAQEDRFFHALREHDGLVEQIFPTERCVLVMATTDRFIDYGDRWVSKVRNEMNQHVFLLVRNGMNIHRVFSPVESHLGSARLFPSTDEHERIFRGFDGMTIKFEDVAYTDRLSLHEKRALHYKRFLILACGLDHRLKLFGDFYDGPQSMHFVSLDFQAQHCRFLRDDDARTMLASNTVRTPVANWIESRNAYLRSGSRVLCNWGPLMNPRTAPGACNRNFDAPGRMERRYKAREIVSVAIAYVDGEDLCVDVPVQGVVNERTFNCRVALTRFRYNDDTYDSTDLPFLCLDAVDPTDVEWYIQHRDSRRDHLTYIRFFKRALKHLEREREQERDARVHLLQAMVAGNIAGPQERPAIIDRAVIAWRAANRGNPLPRVGEAGKEKAWKALLDQMYMLGGNGHRRTADVESFVHASGLEPLRLVLSGASKLVIYAAPRTGERDDRVEPHAWVHRITLAMCKTKLTESTRRWELLPACAASETTLHQWPVAPDWARSTTFGSFAKKQTLFDLATRFRDHLADFTQPMTPDVFERAFANWQRTRQTANSKGKLVANPSLAVPFGVVKRDPERRPMLLCIASVQPAAVLWRLAPDDPSRQRIEAAFAQCYANKKVGMGTFRACIARPEDDWSLALVSADLADQDHFYAHSNLRIELDRVYRRDHTRLLADWLNDWRERDAKDAAVWFAPGALDTSGRLTVDGLLGVRVPEDFCPMHVFEIELSERSDSVKPRVRWFDLVKKDPSKEGSAPEWPRQLSPLVATVRGDVSGGYKSLAHSADSLREAREQIERHGAKDGMRVVRATDLPQAPQPPEGVERWYVLARES